MDRTLVLLAAAFLAVAGFGQEPANARAYLNQGMQAYKDARYPHSKTAHLYLATAYASQYIPGAESPENARLAESAHDEFQAALKLDPNDELATA